MRLRMYAASSCARGEPAGRGPSETWYFSARHARAESKRSARLAIVAFSAGCSEPAPSPPVSTSTSATTTTAGSAIIAMTVAGLVVGGHRLQQVGEAAPGRLAARRDVLGRHAAGGRLVAAQDPPGHALAVHLVGPVVDPRGAREAVHRLQRQVGRVAEGAVDLQRAVDHVVQHGCAVELDQGDLLA